MSALFSTEMNLVSVICWYLTKFFQAHLVEPNYVQVIPAHCMSQLFQFPSWPQSSHFPCSNSDVLPTSNFLDLWYSSGILVTYVPVLSSRRGYRYPEMDRSGIKVLLMFIIMVFLGQSSASRSPSLSRLFILTTAEIHENIWLALVTNTWPLTQRVLPPLTSSRKTSAQWCCVITTPNWPIGLGDSCRRERLISSQQVMKFTGHYFLPASQEVY